MVIKSNFLVHIFKQNENLLAMHYVDYLTYSFAILRVPKPARFCAAGVDLPEHNLHAFTISSSVARYDRILKHP